MAAILIIRESTGQQYLYNKSDDINLDHADTLLQITSHRPKVYSTGIAALKTQKRLEATLTRISKITGTTFTVERSQVEPTGLTARAYRTGAVPPIKVRGG